MIAAPDATAATEFRAATTRLAQDLIRIDSRSHLSNGGIADRLQAELKHFEVERLDYTDPAGVTKHVLVAARGWSGLAFCGHMDTVPDTGWTAHPWDARIEGDTLHGLGAADMKGPVAALVVALRALPPRMPVALFLTTDEETTKQGARVLLTSELARRFRPRAILIAEPTGMIPVRGHRASIGITAIATGVQAHSSTGRGRNANWALIPFLADMHALQDRLRTEPCGKIRPTTRRMPISTSCWTIKAPRSTSASPAPPPASNSATARAWTHDRSWPSSAGPRPRPGCI